MTSHSSEQRRMPAYPPISETGFFAVKEYIGQSTAYANGTRAHPPDDALLQLGLPQGSILSITASLGIQVRDTGSEDLLRTPREFDPEAVASIRFLLAAGGSIGLNRKNMHTPNRKDYPHLRWCIDGRDYKVSLLRIIADTAPGQQTPAADNHYSLRRGDIPERDMHKSSTELTLEGKPTKSPHLGRNDAIILAMRLLRQNARHLGFSITENELRDLLREAFRLLDRRPLKARALSDEH